MTYEARVRPEDKRLPDWVEAQRAKTARALDMIEGSKIAALSGPLDMAKIAMGGALSFLDFGHGVRNWCEGRPDLAV